VDTWTWIPRAENKAADALVNAALDGKRQQPPPSLARARAEQQAAAEDASDGLDRLF
jgi:hypothetical protein